MRKLRLQIEELAVESFSTSAAPSAQGTVLAHSGASCNTADQVTCANYQFATCGGNDTCNQRCTAEIACSGVAECLPLQEETDWLNPGEQADPTPCCTIGCP